jgi:histidine triad (HIT) family protein
MSTIFSKIVSGEIPCYKVAENENYLAFLDINALTMGHTLVIPKKETDYIFDLSDDDLSGLILFSKKVARVLKKHIPCQKIGVSVIGLEVAHAHIHLVPINHVADLNFSGPRIPVEKQKFDELSKLLADDFDMN